MCRKASHLVTNRLFLLNFFYQTEPDNFVGEGGGGPDPFLVINVWGPIASRGWVGWGGVCTRFLMKYTATSADVHADLSLL